MNISDVRASFLAGTLTEHTAYALLRGCGVFQREAESILLGWLDEARDRCLDIQIKGQEEEGDQDAA